MSRFSLRLIGLMCLLIAGTHMAVAADPAQLEARLAQLAPLEARGMDMLALQREVSYELAALPTSERARLEATLFTSRIQQATVMAFEAALGEYGEQFEALEAVREARDGDLAQVTEALRPYIKQLTESVLNNATNASVAETEFPAALLGYFAEQSELRQQMLKMEVTSNSAGIDKGGRTDHTNPSSGSNLNSAARGKRVYSTRAQLLKALVSGDESERWVATANMANRSDWAIVGELEFSGQLKVNFLNTGISAGPTLKFNVTYSAAFDVKGEGMYPLYDSTGLFDLDWKDMNGRPHIVNGKTQRRFVFFTCDAKAEISSEAGTQGKFEVLGVGGAARAASRWTESIEANSRRILVPDTVDGKQVTRAALIALCHNSFLGARTPNGNTIRQNMLISLKNSVSSLVYSNPGMQCVKDAHCANWFKKRWKINKIGNVARCVQAIGNSGLMTCQARSVEGSSCPLRSNGIGNIGSINPLEQPCDKGLKCVRIASLPIVGGLIPMTTSVGICQKIQARR